MTSMLPSRGRAGIVLTMTTVRRLTPQDFLDAQLKPTTKMAAPIIQKLRTIHHRTAILVAEGRPDEEVALLVGYTAQRVRDLKVDPAFSELVSGYKSQITELLVADSARIQAKLVDVFELATDEIQERLEDPKKRGELPIGELRQVAAFAGDRSVAPPKAAPTNTPPPVHVTFNVGSRDIRPKDIVIDANPSKDDD